MKTKHLVATVHTVNLVSASDRLNSPWGICVQIGFESPSYLLYNIC